MTAPDPLGPVVIGVREIYDQLVQLRTAVERLASAYEDVERQIGDHEARIRALERGRWPLPALTVVIAIAALLISAMALKT